MNTSRVTRHALALGLTSLGLGVSIAEAQVEEAWVSNYSGLVSFGSSESVEDLAVRDGFVFVTGHTSNFIQRRWATVKYDSEGQEVWSHISPAGTGESLAIAVDSAGNAYATGWVFLNDDLTATTVKFSPSGEVLWQRNYSGGSGNNQGNAIRLDDAENIYIAGASRNANNNFDVLLLKYDSSGNLLWSRTAGKSNQEDTGREMAIDPSGNILVCGITGDDAYLVKFSPGGDLLWEVERKGYSNNDHWDNVDTDAEGNIYTSGEINPPAQEAHIWTTKYDPNGNILWEQAYDGTGSIPNFSADLAVTSDGGAVVVGQSWDNVIHIFTRRYAPDGTVLWTRLENAGYTHGGGRALALDDSDRVYVTGLAYDDSFQQDTVTLAYSPDGDLLWSQAFADPNDGVDTPHALAIDEASNVFVAGRAFKGIGEGTFQDFNVIRYTQGMGADTKMLSATSGGSVNFSLDAGLDRAFRNYWVLGSVTGTSPGTPLSNGSSLPLNFDAFTELTITAANSPLLVNSFGVLDANGEATAQFNMVPLAPSFLGLEFQFAYTLLAPFGFHSEPVEIVVGQ